MLYEIIIPTTDQGGYENALQVSARSWRDAYATALRQVGSTPVLEGAFVHIGEGTIHVTEPGARRRVRMRRLEESESRDSNVIKALTGAFRLEDLQPPPVRNRPTGPVGFTDKSTGAFRAIGSAEIQQAQQAQAATGQDAPAEAAPAAEAPRVIMQTVQPSIPPVASHQPQGSLPAESVSDSALEDVFLDIMTIFEPGYAMEDAIDYVIELATRYVPSAHGALLFASDQADHLYVAAARSPVEAQWHPLQLSIKDGIPANALKNGVSIALVNPANDKRHRPELEQIGIRESSVLCAPIQHNDRAFGVLLLIDRNGRTFYSQGDANVATYLGQQLGKFIQQLLDSAPIE